MERFEKYLAALAEVQYDVIVKCYLQAYQNYLQFDYNHFSELITNSKWMKSKSSHQHQAEEELWMTGIDKTQSTDPETIMKLQVLVTIIIVN